MENNLVKSQDTNVVATENQQQDPVMWAMSNGATIEQLEKFMELKERHEANEAKKAFVSAMSKFRGKAGTVNKTRQGHNCKYAGLAETIEEISPVLVECGLSHRWETKQEDKQITVTCYLTHEQGHSEHATMTSLPDSTGSKNSIQAIGSAISYLQRYTLFAVCGLASREIDDDGKMYGVDIIDDEQLLNLKALLDEVKPNINYPAFLKAYGIEEPGQMSKANYPRAMKQLEKKRQ